jgi:acyl-CoA reductase-like NAD-dependent aldehyde dehydrogenase
LNATVAVTVLNPATEEPIADLPEAGTEETDQAVARARAAFPSWRVVPPAHRARMLRRLAVLVEEHAEELALLETRNVGKPISDSRGEVGMVAEVFHFYAGAVDKHHGETIPLAGGVDLTFREPLGVVGLIVPWNFPLNIASWKLGPALACGNTVVLKPAELTPLSALRLAELALEAEIPEGVVNVVVGPGRVVGQRHVEHPEVAKIGFTGSTEVGRGVMAAASQTIKRVTLELGGSRRTSSSRTRTSRPQRRRPRWRCSGTRGRTAVRARGSLSSGRRMTGSSSCSCLRPPASRSAARRRRAPRWAR